MARQLVFVTGNVNKLQEAKDILGTICNSFQIVSKDIDIPEYQGSIEYICEKKCKAAAKIIKGPVIVEDSCLCYNAFGGLPGPYVKWFLEELKPEGMYRLLHGFEDKTGRALCTFAYCDSTSDDPTIKLFSGSVEGEIVYPRGSRHFGWDPCFLPKGFDQTYGEMPQSVKNTMSHRRLALEGLKKYLLENVSQQTIVNGY